MLKVFRSRITESMKNSQLDVSLLNAGVTPEDSKPLKVISISYSLVNTCEVVSSAILYISRIGILACSKIRATRKK